MNHNIGDALKSLRVNRNITHEELAKMSGINRYSISRIENNKLSPTIDNLSILCESLKVELHELIFLAKWFKEPTHEQTTKIIIPLLYAKGAIK